MNLKKMKGDQAEEKALQAYLSQGASLLCKNYRVKSGEIDLVFEESIHKTPERTQNRQNRELVIVEVRCRTSGLAWETPAESLSPSKLARLRRATSCFLLDSQWKAHAPYWGSLRFDLAAWDGLSLKIHRNFWWY